MGSVVYALDTAVDAALTGDATLAPKLAGEKVYSLMVPARDTALPYVVLGQSTEQNWYTFDAPNGHDNILTIDVWSDDLTKKTVADLCNDIDRILDGTKLSVGGTHFITGAFSIVAIMVDPSGKFTHASCRYEVLTYA